jgi:hypothetical protein
MLFAAVASILFICDNSYLLRQRPFEDIALENILQAKTDAAGDTYIIHSAMSRIVKMSAGGAADYEIAGESANRAFYNAYEVAAEDGACLFVHDVVWDSSGMSIAYERILEFDKRSGALQGELYRLERDGAGQGLSALVALNALEFEDGKLWFVRKSENAFAVCGLVPGEDSVVEHVVPYDDALSVLDDFAIDIAGGRVFFVEKTGIIKVFDNNEINIVFNPVSGTSVREFSLPYRLSFDGTDLYFSDIGKRAVMRLEGENRAEIVFGGWESVSDIPPLYHSAHANGKLLTMADSGSIVGVSLGGEEIFRVSSLRPGGRIVTRRICMWVSALVLLSSALLAA